MRKPHRLARQAQLQSSTGQRARHERAINNLSGGAPNPATWAKIATSSLDNLHRREVKTLLVEAGHGAGLAIVLGNILDTIPGCIVIGAKLNSVGTLSLTLMLGMFLGGIPEAAASAAMLRKATYRAWTIRRRFWQDLGIFCREVKKFCHPPAIENVACAQKRQFQVREIISPQFLLPFR
jgi:hypothetical protein